MTSTQKNIITVIPFIIICVITAYTWGIILHEGYTFSCKQLVTALLLFFNLMIYFVNQRLALLITGLILVLLTFCMISMTLTTKENNYFLRMGNIKLTTPSINWVAFVLLLLYLVINFRVVKSYYRNLMS